MKSNEVQIIDFKETLREEADRIGVKLTDTMLKRFEIYKNLLLEWNEKMNLTAITKEYEVIIKHFVDCLQLVKNLHPHQSMIDVGTGAGFPGMVLAIYFDELVEITLLDSLNKRLLFLEEVKQQLQLLHVKIVHGRAEEMAHSELFRERYDSVVSRAVANLPVLLEYTTAYVKTGGNCLYMKGDAVDQEIELSKKAMQILHTKLKQKQTYNLTIDQEVFTRNIVVLEKLGETPKQYPRNYGRIKKDNL